MLSLCVAVEAQSTGIDFKPWLAAAEARLGTSPGTLTLDRPAHLDAPLSLGQGHSLVIDAPLRVTHGASIKLLGRNNVRCEAMITTDMPTIIFVADGAAAVSVSSCNATATNPGGFLLSATRSSGVTLTGSNVINMGLFTTSNTGGVGSQTTDVGITGNSSTFPKGNGTYGVYLMYILQGVVANNRFYGNEHGVEWWGGDANSGWRGAAAVVNSADLSITGNVCTNIRAACIWGSMGRNVSVTGNTANGCGDVCFDTEGGVDNLFSGNTARNCGFGCYAAEFESEGTVFTGNLGSSDAGHIMVLIKHGSGNPNSHVNLSITGNTFDCTKVACPALYTEGEDGLFFTHNTVTNGFLQDINYHHDIHITGNTFRFTVDLGGRRAISGPALVNHHVSEISDNFVLNAVKASAPSTCIGQDYSDYNDMDEMYILRNTCIGFDAGIATNSSGGNPGAPHAVWLISGNHVSAVQPYVHVHPSGNESYNFMPDNTQENGLSHVVAK